MSVIDHNRVAEISESINILPELAEIIELYDGQLVLVRALIAWIFMADEFSNHMMDSDIMGCPRVTVRLLACKCFPFCCCGVLSPCTCRMQIFASDDYSGIEYLAVLSPAEMCWLIIDDSSSWLSRMLDCDRYTNRCLLLDISEWIYNRAHAIVAVEYAKLRTVG